jgi:AraC family ethanolamine operon transcriptional activator
MLHVEQRRIDGIEDVRRILEAPQTSCVPLGSGVPKGTIFRVAVGEVLLRAGEISADIRTRTSIDANLISFSMMLDSDGTLFSFRSVKEVLPGEVYRLARGDVNDYRLYGQMRYAVLSLSAHQLLKYGGEDALSGDVGFWEQRQWFRASEATRAFVARNVRRVTWEILQLEGKTVPEPALEQLQAALVEPFLWGVMFDEQKPDERHTLSGSTIVRKVEDWIDEQSVESIKIPDLCRALRLRRRTLQRAFTETLGMGPARYLKLRRLAAVRAVLRSSDPRLTNVTHTAGRYGFWELGRFAREYRRVFGERPSDTLANGTG